MGCLILALQCLSAFMRCVKFDYRTLLQYSCSLGSCWFGEIMVYRMTALEMQWRESDRFI